MMRILQGIALASVLMWAFSATAQPFGASGGGSSGGGIGTPGTPSIAGGVASASSPASGQTGGQPLSLDGNDNLRVTLGNTTISLGAGTAAIGTVGVTSLPTGLAQDGTDATAYTPPAGATGIRGALSAIYGVLNGTLRVQIQAGGATQPVSASALPLPAGAATAAGQPTINGDGGGQVHVQNFPATQPITGNVGGYTGLAQVTPTVSTTAYAAGQSIGGLLTLSGLVRTGQTGALIQSVALGFADAQSGSIDVLVFAANPTASTITNGSAVAVAAADIGKLRGVVHVSDCASTGTGSLCQGVQQALSIVAANTGGPLYAALVARTALTLASTSDLTVSVTGPGD